MKIHRFTINEYSYLGIIEGMDDSGRVKITQRNKFCVGERIEIMKPDGRNIPVTVKGIYTEEGEAMESAPHPKQALLLELSERPGRYDLLRMENKG